MSENIVVYGAGAIGSQVAGRIHGSGIPLTLIEPWDPQRNAVKESGILLRHEGQPGEDEHYMPPVIGPEELGKLPGPIDTLLLCVKSYDTIEVLKRVLPYLASNGLVVSLQNSINEEWIAPIIGPERTMGGVILINAVLLEPGVVTLTNSVSQASSTSGELPGVYVGEYQASAGENAFRITNLLNAVWPAVSVDDLIQQRWSKLATNTMINTVSALSGLGSKELLSSHEARRLIITIGAEILRVAEAEGYPLRTLMGDYSATDILAGAAGFSRRVDQGLAARATLVSERAMPSMLQDVLRSRKTEADFFSGLISRKGFNHGIKTPLCRAATELAHLVEDGLPATVKNLTEVVRRAKYNLNP